MSDIWQPVKDLLASDDPTRIFSYGIGILTTITSLTVALLLYVTRKEDR